MGSFLIFLKERILNGFFLDISDGKNILNIFEGKNIRDWGLS